MGLFDKLAGGLGNARRRLSEDPIMYLLSGKTSPEIYEEVNVKPGPGMKEGSDKTLHRNTSKRMASRFGAPIARLIGLGHEVESGIREMRGGQPFLSPRGFDPADLNANEAGFEQAGPMAQFGPGAELLQNVPSLNQLPFSPDRLQAILQNADPRLLRYLMMLKGR